VSRGRACTPPAPVRLTCALACAFLTCAIRSAPGDEERPESGRARLFVFTLEEGRAVAPPDAPQGPLPIGSLAKPFVALAWARAHPGTPSPVVRCTQASRCWTASGHGAVGLVRATAVSCNSYFRALAAETPSDTLASTLREAGFLVPDPLDAEAAIGLPNPAGLLSAEPAAVLRAYAALLREPWPRAEELRRELLAGLRDSARVGTAAGLADAGFHAKTGTVPAIDGRPRTSSGWAIAIDEAGRGALALLHPGTGRQAARALASRLRVGAAPAFPLAALPATPAPPRPRGVSVAHGDRDVSARPVRVSLFTALAPTRVRARNVGPSPLATSRGFVGPQGALELRAGDRLDAGDWELALPASGLRRGVRGALRVDAGPRSLLRVLAEVAPIDYVAGVLRAESPGADPELRRELAAAVLRFLAEGPRHGDADVCDLTHCAFFVGRGPRVAWAARGRGALLEAPEAASIGEAEDAPALDELSWQAALASARHEGPARWTSHCGGESLCPHAVWGGGDRRVFRCQRHGAGDRACWTRRWRQRDVDAALGGRVEELHVAEQDGRWALLGRRDDAPLRLFWDEAHARLAGVLGWGALPSPADRVARETGGFRAEGRGLGHRVGLCLGATPAGALLD